MLGEMDEDGLFADKISAIKFFSFGVENTVFDDLFVDIKSDVAFSCMGHSGFLSREWKKVGSFGKYLFEIKSQPGESFGLVSYGNGLEAPIF
jgi:hypothetical protein